MKFLIEPNTQSSAVCIIGPTINNPNIISKYKKSGFARIKQMFTWEQIAKKYEAAGYKMPRLIFWNVCGRTDTIPMVNNEEGLCLLSGFSQNAMKVAADKTKKDPYEALIATLDSPRYQKIEEAIKDLVA